MGQLKQDEWGVAELHGTDLSDDQVWEVCRFMGSLRIPGLVQATDTEAVSVKDIENHRLNQAARFTKTPSPGRRPAAKATTSQRGTSDTSRQTPTRVG